MDLGLKKEGKEWRFDSGIKDLEMCIVFAIFSMDERYLIKL